MNNVLVLFAISIEIFVKIPQNFLTMAKSVQEFVKFTTKELDQYTQTKGSCVSKVNTNLHLNMTASCLADFKRLLVAHLMRSKVGSYDIHLDGIVLDVKKIKVLDTIAAIRADDPRIHININADVYIFKPEEGAELTGVVKHIGLHQVGVILYRVFSVNLRVNEKIDKTGVQMDQEVKFRIRKYNLQNVYPYIDGELLIPGTENNVVKNNKIVFKQEDNGDSGIEERDGGQELDELLTVIKTEVPSEYEQALDKSNKKKSKKSKKDKSISEDSAADDSQIKSPDKLHKKRKSSSALLSTEEDPKTLTANSVKKIKSELSSSDDSMPATPKKVNKEQYESFTKKHKSKNMFLDEDVKIKEEYKNY